MLHVPLQLCGRPPHSTLCVRCCLLLNRSLWLQRSPRLPGRPHAGVTCDHVGAPAHLQGQGMLAKNKGVPPPRGSAAGDQEPLAACSGSMQIHGRLRVSPCLLPERVIDTTTTVGSGCWYAIPDYAIFGGGFVLRKACVDARGPWYWSACSCAHAHLHARP